MAVNPIQFLVAQNASITDGTKIISVSGNVDCSRVYSGTAIFLGGADNPAEAVSGTSPDGSGVSTVTLRNNWSQGDVVNQQLVSFNTNEGLAEAISNVRDIVSNVSAIEDLATQGLIKRISDNEYEVVNISTIGESLITANDASSQRSVLGLGGAATKNVGTSSGNVMEVGAFGLGDDEYCTSLSDMDAHQTTGLFSVRDSNLPPASGLPQASLGNVLQMNRASSRRNQIYITDVNESEVYFRTESSDDIWNEWRRVYHSGNSVNPLDYGIGYRSFFNVTDWNSIPNDFRGTLRVVYGASNPPSGLDPLRVYHGVYIGSSFDPMIKVWGGTGSQGYREYTIHVSYDSDSWTGTPTYTLAAENYTSGNTNFNEFGGVNAGDVISTGIATSTTEVRFFLPLNSKVSATGMTLGTGLYSIKTLNGAVTGNNNLTLANTLSSLSGNKMAVLIVTGLSGLTIGDSYRLETESVNSVITINF